MAGLDRSIRRIQPTRWFELPPVGDADTGRISAGPALLLLALPGTLSRVNLPAITNSAWAILFARLVLGLIFGMAGWGKVFKMGPVEHAHRYFVDPYATSWIPAWLLWALGLSIPFVELAAGWLVFVGLFVRPALLALGAVLVIVTYGHLLKDFLYEFHTHVIPRLALLLFILAMPRALDVLSLDHLLGRR